MLAKVFQVGIEQVVREFDQLLVKPTLVHADFVTGTEQYRHSGRIKRERDSDFGSGSSDAKFFHVSVLRAGKYLAQA